MDHRIQNLYDLVKNLEKTHRKLAVIEVQSMNGHTSGIQVHTFDTQEQAAAYIKDQELKGRKLFTTSEQSIILEGRGREDFDQEFIVMDKDRLEKLINEMIKLDRQTELSHEPISSSRRLSLDRSTRTRSPLPDLSRPTLSARRMSYRDYEWVPTNVETQ